ncbi:hypothetical protein [Tianweitania sediminis]|uniref:Uncharacterized protein n=1 Tax=Tianweitania sediminis TaxID=1502156 RepID=A0A8J7UKJ8_9HYPH|nr:hypothetical protein [Tianweitania sediminis]MBP0441258.1 hypothetical protein [Tianweitania sediminis]
MRKVMTSAGLALAVAMGSFAGVSSAFAQGLELQIGPDGIKPVQRDRDRDRDRRDARRGGCSEREARAAAREEGLRDPEVIRVTSRSITVEGDTRRGVETIRFANAPGCPEI